MKFTDSFEEIYHNGYINKNISLLEAETINNLNAQLAGASTDLGLPACHLNFSNLGNIEFSFMNISASPVNYKMFHKLQKLSGVIRNINRSFIDLILEFKCCDIASTYNDTIIPIFEWVLQDFIKTLIDIAESLIKGYQGFKVLTCVLRPVPGNPWMGSGGFDWMSSIYSYLNGFEAVYNWVIDGNPIDYILNPVEDFYKRISSCTSRPDAIQSIETGLQDEQLAELMRQYTIEKDSVTTEEEQKAANITRIEYKKMEDERIEKMREISTKSRWIRYLKGFNGSFDEISNAEDELEGLELELQVIEISYKKVIHDYEIITKKKQLTYETSIERLNNSTLVQKNIDQLVIDQFDPACSCLTGLLGIGAYKPPKYITVSNKHDVELLLTGKVHWSDKTLWQENITNVEEGELLFADDLNNIYITYDNIAKKYAQNNTNVDRDNSITTSVFIDNIYAEDYFTTIIPYSTIDYYGFLRDHEFDTSIDPLFNLNPLLYQDTGHSSGTNPHSKDDITSIFILNSHREEEKFRINKNSYIIRSKQVQIETKLEKIWNVLRRNALEKIRYQKFSEVTDSELEWFDNIVFTAIVFTDNLVYDTIELLDGQVMLEKLGNHFDIKEFMLNFNSDTNEDILNYTNTEHVDFIDGYVPSDLYEVFDTTDGKKLYIGNFQELKTEWALLEEDIAKIKAANIRLDNLIILDNVVVEIVGDGIDTCGCDILCVLLQWVLDLILSTVKGLIKSIIDKIIKMVVSEEVSYILKFILHQAQCSLDLIAIPENIENIKKHSDALIEQNKSTLTKMEEQLYCEPEYLDLSDDDIPLSVGEADNFTDDDTIIPVMPAFGVVGDIEEPGNIIINNGTTIGNQLTGRHIPTLTYNCINDATPNIEINIEERSSYEIMVVFRPSDYINTASIIEVDQDHSELADIVDTIEAEKTIETIDGINTIMNNVVKQINEANISPIYMETDCSDTLSGSNNLTLCNTENLFIYEIGLMENDTLLVDPDFNTYGSFTNNPLYPSVNDNFIEYWPEHIDSDENGFVQINELNAYYELTIPEPIVHTNDPIVSSPIETIMPEGTDTTPKIIETTNTEWLSHVFNSYFVSISYTYEIVDDIITETKIQTTTLTTTTYFRKNDLEIFIEFRNKVNRLKIRLVLDVINYESGERPTSYLPSTYFGQYTNVAEAGYMNSYNSTVFKISMDRIMYLCNNLLEDNYLISNVLAVVNKIETQIANEPNNCLLPDDQKKLIEVDTAAIDNITAAANEAIKSLENVVDELPTYNTETLTEAPIKIKPIIKSIPFMVLNKEQDIIIQVVEKKMYLQFKTNSFINSEPIVIDYELVPDDIYMFIFNTNGFIFKMSLITPDKQIIEASGMNTSGYSLLPSIIGGNVDGTASFCGEILDLIISKSGNHTLDYYKLSLLGYIPRQAEVLFDFSLYNNTRVYNTVNKAGNVFLNTEGGTNGFLEPLPMSNQKADAYGTVLKNDFYQVFEGYMDNFFCKDNLNNKDFTISMWVYNLNSNNSRHIIMADDIGNNYITYNGIDNKISMDFKNAQDFLFIQLDEWTHITLKHILYANQYQLIIHTLNDIKHTITLNTTDQFALMSLFGEYSYDARRYVNIFDGYMAAISIFFQPIDNMTYNDLHYEQAYLIRGMENVSI